MLSGICSNHGRYLIRPEAEWMEREKFHLRGDHWRSDSSCLLGEAERAPQRFLKTVQEMSLV